MSEQILGQQQGGWKVWASALAGALIAFVIGKLSEVGSDQVFLQPGQDVGFAIGSGLIVGLIVWLVFNFTTLRGSGWLRKLVVFLLIVAGAALGVMQNF